MSKNTVDMIINPEVLKGIEEQLEGHVIEAQQEILKADMQDKVIANLSDDFSSMSTLKEISVEIHANRQAALQLLANTLIDAPVKKVKRKYKKRVIPAPVVNAPKVSKKKRSPKKSVKKSVKNVSKK